MKRWWLTLMLILLPLIGVAADEGWKLERDRDGIQVFSRSVDGWSIHEMRTITHLQGSLAAPVAVLNDIGALPELNAIVSKSEVRQRVSDVRYQWYAQIQMPWPLTDRDVLYQREITRDVATGVVSIMDTAVDDVSAGAKGFVHIIRSRQSWTFMPSAAGGVDAEMRLLSDPAGPIPASVINALLVGAPFKTMSKVREFVQKPQYNNASLPFAGE